MRVVEVYVERLKSYGDYSNRRLGLKAVLDDGEDYRDVYVKLAAEVETLLEKERIEADKASVEAEIKAYEKRVQELRKLRDEFIEMRSQVLKGLAELEKELEKYEKRIEEGSFPLKLLEKLREIRRAIGFYDP